MRRITLAVLSLLVLTTAALAQDSTVTFPVGEWIVAVLPIAAFVVLVLVIVALGFIVKWLPPWAQALAGEAQQKYLVGLAANVINSAFQATAGAVKGVEIKLDVGNPLVAKAAQEAINTWPKAVVDKLGGIEGVKKFIVSRLEEHNIILPADSTTADILNSPAVAAVQNPR